MKALKRKDLVKLLNTEGFFFDNVGEHEIYKNQYNWRIAVPMHREISPGTMRNILKSIKKSKEIKG